MNEIDEYGFAIRPNKTQLKQELAENRLLVLKLIGLAEKELLGLDLTDEIVVSLKQIKGMKADNARKRQVKHIARLLSGEDDELVKHYFDERDARQRQLNHKFHQLQQLGDRMIEEGDQVLQEFLDEHGVTDRQQLRQALRNARKQPDPQKPTAAGKKLFGLLREVLMNAEAPLK